MSISSIESINNSIAEKNDFKQNWIQLQNTAESVMNEPDDKLKQKIKKDKKIKNPRKRRKKSTSSSSSLSSLESYSNIEVHNTNSVNIKQIENDFIDKKRIMSADIREEKDNNGKKIKSNVPQV